MIFLHYLHSIYQTLNKLLHWLDIFCSWLMFKLRSRSVQKAVGTWWFETTPRCMDKLNSKNITLDIETSISGWFVFFWWVCLQNSFKTSRDKHWDHSKECCVQWRNMCLDLWAVLSWAFVHLADDTYRWQDMALGCGLGISLSAPRWDMVILKLRRWERVRWGMWWAARDFKIQFIPML